LTLTTLRSHDQYNTTIYGMNDRYRGITGRRDVVFVNEQDLARRGLSHGDLIDIVLDRPDSAPRALRRVTAVAYNIPQGSVAAYYPESSMAPIRPILRMSMTCGQAQRMQRIAPV
jgi:anaerobic selenocysteine-containing dehydrogenase